MKSIIKLLKKCYISITGYSYTNLGRLFLRLFVGIMLMQFGVREIAHFYEMQDTFPALFGMSSNASLVCIIFIEIVCSVFIMFGFLTRLMCLPPFFSMLVAEIFLLKNSTQELYLLSWQQVGFLPMMFMGIYFFLLLVGPGKISVDYFLSLYFIHNDNKSESELEEV